MKLEDNKANSNTQPNNAHKTYTGEVKSAGPFLATVLSPAGNTKAPLKRGPLPPRRTEPVIRGNYEPKQFSP